MSNIYPLVTSGHIISYYMTTSEAYIDAICIFWFIVPCYEQNLRDIIFDYYLNHVTLSFSFFIYICGMAVDLMISIP